MKKIIIILFLLTPVFAFAQEDSAKKQAYFFFLPSCPHCQNVEKYFDDNGIWDKYQITKMDATNPFNGRLLLKFQDIYNSPQKGSVPTIVFGDKYIEGDQPIIANFVKEIDTTDNANSLPDPEKLTNNTTTAGQPATGNKKSYLPVIITALVVVGAGALIYINRKK